MCVWGEAFALGPNLNSFDEPRLLESLPLAYEKAKQAALMSASKFDTGLRGKRRKCDDLELRLIRALLVRYATSPEEYVAQESKLTRSFSREMTSVLTHCGGPQSNPNVAALAADALMNTEPWNYWSSQGKARPAAHQALTILKEALLSNPRHAFCIHLYVHVTEASGDHALLNAARPFAELLPKLMPGAPHLVHMSFHTLMHTGDFYVADIDNGRASSLPRQIYPMHNLDTLSWVCRIQGISSCSLDAAKSLEHLALPLATAQVKRGHVFDSFGFVVWSVAVFSRALLCCQKYSELLHGPEHACAQLNCTLAFQSMPDTGCAQAWLKPQSRLAPEYLRQGFPLLVLRRCGH